MNHCMTKVKFTIACFSNKSYSKIMPAISSFGILISTTAINIDYCFESATDIFPIKHRH